jgi:hypothetical protein
MGGKLLLLQAESNQRVLTFFSTNYETTVWLSNSNQNNIPTFVAAIQNDNTR